MDILIDREGNWHALGLPISPADLMHKIDVAWNLSEHPGVSSILDDLFILNIGAESFLKALENNSDTLRKHIKDIGVKVPRSILLPLYQKDFDGPKDEYVIAKAKEVLNKFSAPWIIKSFVPDSNMGIHLAKTFPELVEAIEDGVMHNKSILIEEFILGKVGSVHSILGFRGHLYKDKKNIYTFPLINSLNVFSTTEKEKIISVVQNLYKHLGVKHYLKSDFVLHPKNGLYITNISFLPDLKKGSHFEESCESIGVKMHEVVDHILEKALDKKVL